jgi:hypothetical protein
MDTKYCVDNPLCMQHCSLPERYPNACSIWEISDIQYQREKQENYSLIETEVRHGQTGGHVVRHCLLMWSATLHSERKPIPKGTTLMAWLELSLRHVTVEFRSDRLGLHVFEVSPLAF